MTVLDRLLTDLPTGWLVTDVYVGANWIVSLVTSDGQVPHSGVATVPTRVAAQPRFPVGHYKLDAPADEIARLLRSEDGSEAAVGLATLNALIEPAEHRLATDDAANWLAAQCVGRNLAIFGRFPFIEDELRPVARQVWVFEQQPRANEYDKSAIPTLIPRADMVAITGSSVINHTIDTILPCIKPGSKVVLLGPSTPLSEKFFDVGIDALFGVRVANVQQVIESVQAGAGFQKMQGLQRIALFKGDA